MNGRAHLEAGLFPLILSDPDDPKKKGKKTSPDEMEETMDRVCLGTVIVPPLTLGPSTSQALGLEDLSFLNKAKIYEAVMTASVSLYYGTDRGMRGSKDRKLKIDQGSVTEFFYRCCSELGDSWDDLMGMEEPRLAERLAALQAGDAYRQRMIRKSQGSGAGNPRGRRSSRG